MKLSRRLTQSSTGGCIGAEVIDAAGERLGTVIRESAAWFLVERAGTKTVIVNSEVAAIERGRIRLRLARSAMIRKDRPQVTELDE
jgi:hypothetical protein